MTDHQRTRALREHAPHRLGIHGTGFRVDIDQQRIPSRGARRVHVVQRRERRHQERARAAGERILIAGAGLGCRCLDCQMQRGRGGGAVVGHRHASAAIERGCQLAGQLFGDGAGADLLGHQALEDRVHLAAADRGPEQRYRGASRLADCLVGQRCAAADPTVRGRCLAVGFRRIPWHGVILPAPRTAPAAVLAEWTSGGPKPDRARDRARAHP